MPNFPTCKLTDIPITSSVCCDWARLISLTSGTGWVGGWVGFESGFTMTNTHHVLKPLNSWCVYLIITSIVPMNISSQSYCVICIIIINYNFFLPNSHTMPAMVWDQFYLLCGLLQPLHIFTCFLVAMPQFVLLLKDLHSCQLTMFNGKIMHLFNIKHYNLICYMLFVCCPIISAQ